MPLPKLNVPVYETILPSTNEVIKFRPFLVKEEKVLLTAGEDGSQIAMMNAIKQIVANCVQQELDVDKLPMFDLEFIFLRLRSKSIGEEIEVNLKCQKENCNGTGKVMVNAEEINVTKPEGHNKKIMITDDVGVVMRYPVIDTLGIAEQDGMKVVKECIDMIFTKDETHERDSFDSKELDDFLESMDSKQFIKIRDFFETMPKLEHKVDFVCSMCGTEEKVTLEGIDSFFD